MPNELNTLLSVIIPTKDRYSTLFPVIKALIKNIDDERLEIIIQDNTEINSEGRLFFDNLDDKRVKYYHSSLSISITENTILSINNSTGKYLLFIGDDDIVSPYIMKIMDLIDNENYDCITYTPAYYWWESVSFAKETYFHRKKALWIPKNINIDFQKRNSENELKSVLNNGAVSYGRLPRFYHGIVKRSVLNDIKAKVGTYLPGSCPDIAFSVSLSNILIDYHFCKYPISVFGASKNSGGGWSASKRHFGKIEDQKFLPSNILDNWDSFVPLIWSEVNIYAQTTYEVLSAFRSNLRINYLALYGTLLAFEPYLFEYISPKIKLFCKTNFLKYLIILLFYTKRKIGILHRYIKIRTKTFDFELEFAENIENCMKILNEKTKISD